MHSSTIQTARTVGSLLSFQSLWHSNVFHSAFEHIVVRPIDEAGSSNTLKEGSVTRGLLRHGKCMETCLVSWFLRVRWHLCVETILVIPLIVQCYCISKDKERRTRLTSHLGHALFGKSLRKGHGVVCTWCLVFECEAREFQSFHTFMSINRVFSLF